VIVAGAVMLPVSFLVSSPTALVMAPPVHSLPWYAVTKSDPRTRNSLSLGQALAYEPDDFRTLRQRVA
jgi:hypothetical protein